MSVFGKKDEAAIGNFATSVPVPEFETTSFNTPNPLSEVRVEIVTTAALHQGKVEPDSNSETMTPF